MHWENNPTGNDGIRESSNSCKTQRASKEVMSEWQKNFFREVTRKFFRVAKGEESGQPAAADMRELVWDDELEQIAQR